MKKVWGQPLRQRTWTNKKQVCDDYFPDLNQPAILLILLHNQSFHPMEWDKCAKNFRLFDSSSRSQQNYGVILENQNSSKCQGLYKQIIKKCTRYLRQTLDYLTREAKGIHWQIIEVQKIRGSWKINNHKEKWKVTSL